VVGLEELMPSAPPFIAAARRGVRPGHGAFTLIEMLIAIALSSVIIYTVFAAFRVVSQSIAISKRMSVENGMMRTGYFAALDELDFWDLYDDRHAVNPSTNPLRAVGKPFCPITYDPTKKESDPQTWWRGFGFGTDAAATMKWGNYALLSKAGHSDPLRAWYPDQIKNINEQMGAYGMISYLLPDAIYCWYTAAGPGGLAITGQPRDIWERTATTPVTVNGKTFDQSEGRDFLPQHPAHWPGLMVKARRYAVWSSFIDLCQVEMTSPISGETTRLSFWGVGTSLRGARQQRNLDTVLVR
jgi:prepilin-type N-terminal cleavage/methylation domain-containing protein